MQITDTIADMLTRIRNASAAKHDSVDVPASKVKKAIAQILLDESINPQQCVERGGIIRSVKADAHRAHKARKSAIDNMASVERRHVCACCNPTCMGTNNMVCKQGEALHSSCRVRGQ
jgi:ribosomal protein S8